MIRVDHVNDLKSNSSIKTNYLRRTWVLFLYRNLKWLRKTFNSSFWRTFKIFCSETRYSMIFSKYSWSESNLGLLILGNWRANCMALIVWFRSYKKIKSSWSKYNLYRIKQLHIGPQINETAKPQLTYTGSYD